MTSQALWMLRYVINNLRRQLNQWNKDLTAWLRFWNSYRQYCQLVPPSAQPSLKNLYPCLGEDTPETPIEPIYFYQDSWAFEKILKHSPVFHVDVGSHHKFVALLSKAIPVTFVDVRPLSLPLDSLKFQKGSILSLPFRDTTVPSVSSLCVVEHIGLGRYGDPLDPLGSEKAIQELKRIVQPGGNLYLSLPLDNENRTYFNAHRAFKEDYLFSLFEPFEIIECRYIYGRNFGNQRKSEFGTGCYHLKRPI